ncbi:MAG: NRAMP family divalent metal transporter [Thermoleophilaceae bacterium]
MSKVLQLALGILAAIGGFVDIGDLVFATQAGAKFGYGLLWALAIGVLGIVVYAEMSGRVAAVARRPVFDIVRQRLGFGLGLTTLVGSLAFTLLTLAAELGGVALILQLLLDAGYPLLVIGAALIVGVSIWLLPFEWIERIFGFGGLLLIVYVVASLKLHPDWGDVGNGFVPHIKGSAVYLYFVVGLMAAALMPYEVYFYSSGAVEERWTEKDVKLNRINAILGFGVGGMLALAIIAASAETFFGTGVEPEFIGTTALAAQIPLGEAGLLLAAGGILFAVAGAAIDTTFAAAYSLAQFCGWEWGKYKTPKGAPRFTLAWMAFLLLGFVIVESGVDPLQLTEYAVVLSVVALPLTYVPILLMGRDRLFMGDYANGRLSSALGWIYLVVITIIAVAAIPLLIATNAGGG